MTPEKLMRAGITEEAAAEWWLKTFANVDGPLVVGGRLNKRGTPIFDTNWCPAIALYALKLRAIGFDRARISKMIGKSWHAVSDLFERVDTAKTRIEADV